MSISVRSRWSRLAIGILLTPPLAVVCMPAYAQSGALEEVVVVARKREESLQDTPVAVSAFNTDQLREAQITNVADLAQQVPGLSNKDGDKVSGLTIRGVGARAVGAAIDPGVGVYVDGIFYAPVRYPAGGRGRYAVDPGVKGAHRAHCLARILRVALCCWSPESPRRSSRFRPSSDLEITTGRT